MTAPHLCVPIKLEALVIDDLTVATAGPNSRDGFTFPGDGKWSPRASNYQRVVNALESEGPAPFLGGQRGKLQGISPPKQAQPSAADRGVYLHWTPPAALRRARSCDLDSFPNLPDQWLLIRYAQHASQKPKTSSRAWLIDSSAIDPAGKDANLIHSQKKQRRAVKVGIVTPLEDYSAKPTRDRAALHALGNRATSARSFTAQVSNLNGVFAYHDDLVDLRDQDGKLSADLTLSYHICGWYRLAQDDPLATQSPSDLGWSCATEAPIDTSLFHSSIHHINYWSPQYYRGPMLGYPGAPSAQGGLRQARRTLKVGVGNSAQDALSALIANPNQDDAMWQALEAVAYRKPQTLLDGWDDSIRLREVHSAAFKPVASGLRWTIQPKSRDQQRQPKPVQLSSEQNQLLQALNRAQNAADQHARQGALLQQDYYQHWWRACRALRLEDWDNLDQAEAACEKLAQQIEQHKQPQGSEPAAIAAVRLLRQLRASIDDSEYQIEPVSGPRFWQPSDPVIMIQNYGNMDKHRQKKPPACRTTQQLVATASSKDKQNIAPFPQHAKLDALLQRHLPTLASSLSALDLEARILETFTHYRATQNRPAQGFSNETAWRAWLDQLQQDLANPNTTTCSNSQKEAIARPAINLWREQPWSPLYLDWQVRWYPSEPHKLGQDWQPQQTDYSAKHGPAGQPVTLRGRSQLTPIDGNLVQQPLDDLHHLIEQDPNHPVSRKLAETLTLWQQKLDDIYSGGLLGQSLEGLHQRIAGRDPERPSIQPDPQIPWYNDQHPDCQDSRAAQLLATPAQHVNHPNLPASSFTPPANQAMPSPWRAGHLVIEELWLIDDFGQWVDLRLGSSAGGSLGLQLNPHLRSPHDAKQQTLMLPPRLLNPTRLNFKFTNNSQAWLDGQRETPVVAWFYYNYFDDALCICEGTGQNLGSFSLTSDSQHAHWQPAQGSVPETLAPLIQQLQQKDHLASLLQLIDQQLQNIESDQPQLHEHIAGKPLALVATQLGLESFGQSPSGDLAQLSLPVRLGHQHNPHDGLIGFFKDQFQQLVPSYSSKPEPPTSWLGSPVRDSIQLRFNKNQNVYLLMDPGLAITASMHLLPTKSLRLPDSLIRDALQNLQPSFQVGPVLLPAGEARLPAPFSASGEWQWQGEYSSESVPLEPLQSGADERLPSVASGRLQLHIHPDRRNP